MHNPWDEWDGSDEPGSSEDGTKYTLVHYGKTGETEKAVCLKMQPGDSARCIWWPKSQILKLGKNSVTVTEWIYFQKEMAHVQER